MYYLCKGVYIVHTSCSFIEQFIAVVFLSFRSPPANQFLCRAYLCQAQLIAPQSSDQFEDFEKSVVYLLKAISFAKETPRYVLLIVI